MKNKTPIIPSFDSSTPSAIKHYFASLSLLFTMAANTLYAAEIIMHTGDMGTSSTGSWYSASAATMPIDNNRGLYTTVDGETKTYRFANTMPAATSYQLQIYNTCYSASQLASNAHLNPRHRAYRFLSSIKTAKPIRW